MRITPKRRTAKPEPTPAPERALRALPSQGPVPRHVAIVMDGNGRWAKERGMSRQAGHRAGTENIRRIIQAFGERGVEVLTLYAFSTENWARPKAEVNALMRLIPRVVQREVKELHKRGVRLVHIGDMTPLKPELRQKVEDAIALTKDNDRMTVALAFNYGGRAEISEAVRRMIRDRVKPGDIDEALVSSYLYTSGLPDPDLIIRTGGDARLSNFLIWQAAYAEFYSSGTYWPDFDEAEIDRALESFAARERRFGGASAAGPAEATNGHKPPAR